MEDFGRNWRYPYSGKSLDQGNVFNQRSQDIPVQGKAKWTPRTKNGPQNRPLSLQPIGNSKRLWIPNKLTLSPPNAANEPYGGCDHEGTGRLVPGDYQ